MCSAMQYNFVPTNFLPKVIKTIDNTDYVVCVLYLP